VRELQAWAITVAIIASARPDGWQFVGSVLAVVMLMVDDREQRRAASGETR
jgi:hypothetical protein